MSSKFRITLLSQGAQILLFSLNNKTDLKSIIFSGPPCTNDDSWPCLDVAEAGQCETYGEYCSKSCNPGCDNCKHNFETVDLI